MANGAGGGAGPGYSGSLFNPQGPALFATAVDLVAKSIGRVNAGFVQMSEKSTTALKGISAQFTTILSQASQFSQLSGQGPMGGGTQAGGAPGGVNPGGVGGRQGNTMGSGGDFTPPPDPSTQRQGQPQGNVADTPPPGGNFGIMGRFGQLAQQFGPGTAGGAALAAGAAGASAVAGFVQGQQGNAIQGDVWGQQATRAFGGTAAGYEKYSARSTGGITPLAGSPADFFQSQQTALLQGAIAPLNARSTPFQVQQQRTLQGSLNTQIGLTPGISQTEATNAYFSLNTPQSLTLGRQYGLNYRGPQGNLKDISQNFQDILDRITNGKWKTMDQQTLLNQFIPGNSGAVMASQLITDPTLYSQFMNYVQAASGYAGAHGGQAPAIGPAGDKQLGLMTGRAASDIQKKAAQAQATAQTLPDINKAAQLFNEGATTFWKGVNALLGGGAKTSTLKGILGSSPSWYPSWLKSANTWFSGQLTGGGGAAAATKATNLGGGSGGTPLAPSTVVNTTQGIMTWAQAQAQGLPITTGGAFMGASMGMTLAGGASAIPARGAAAAGLAAILAAKSGSASTGTGTGTGTGSAGSPSPAGSTAGTASKAAWAALLLTDVKGVPITQNNVDNIRRWMSLEEPSSNWSNRNNPLNASLGTSASDGTASYKDLSTAAQFTAAMINQKNMSAIKAALASNASPSDFAAAIKSSPWASSHYPSTSPQNFASTGLATGSYNITQTQLYMLHRGERVIPAADNWTNQGRYTRLDASGGTGGGTVHLNFAKSSIQLVVPPNATATDMDQLATQFVASLSKPQILARVRSN